MNNPDPHRDVFGNIDDFNAVPGKVSSPFVRKLHIDSSLPQEFKNYLKLLFDNGYPKGEVCSVLIRALNSAYNDVMPPDAAGGGSLSVGDLVRVPPNEKKWASSVPQMPGVITSHIIDVKHSYEISWPDGPPSGGWEEWTLELIE